MRARLIAVAVALVVLLGCKKSSSPASSAAAPPASPAAADALWALAPPDATTGMVITPRGLHLLEGAALTLQDLGSRAEMQTLAEEPMGKLHELLGGKFTSLADLGLDHDRGLALWETAGGGMIVVLPIEDPARLHKLIGDDRTAPDRFGELVCKTINGAQACATDPAVLDTLGKAALPAPLAALGARGDIELVSSGTAAITLVVQLDRGAAVLRGSANLPPPLLGVLGDRHRPRTESSTVAFGVAAVGPVLRMMPEATLVPGVTTTDLAGAVSGPMTITIAAGTTAPDLRVPFSDPAPINAMVAGCDQLVPPAMRVATATPGICRIRIPDYGAMELDLWVEGNELRIGQKTAPPAGKAVAMTALGTEIAGGEWGFGFWGRGSIFGGTSVNALPPGMPGGVAAVARLMSLFNELGIAVRLDGGTARFIVGVRTVWANPPAVAARLLAVPVDDIVAGKADRARAAAGSGTPLADDLAAGQGGLMVPAAVTGMLAAIAIPAFLDYQKKGKRSEAELNLGVIAKSARVTFAETAALPRGGAPLTPAVSCCEFPPDRRCPPVAADWAIPAWEQLDFEMYEPTRFRYGYQSDGATLTATAVGDLDCDGTEVTYTLTITTDTGAPLVSISSPANAD